MIRNPKVGDRYRCAKIPGHHIPCDMVMCVMAYRGGFYHVFRYRVSESAGPVCERISYTKEQMAQMEFIDNVFDSLGVAAGTNHYGL